MALTHLLDNSVLIRLGRPTVRAAVEPLAVAGTLARPSIWDLEIGSSARNAQEWGRAHRRPRRLRAGRDHCCARPLPLHVQRPLAAAS